MSKLSMKISLTDSQRWGLALGSHLNEQNNDRHDTLCHYVADSESKINSIKSTVKRDWGISTRNELIEMLDWLIIDGHNKEYLAGQAFLNSLPLNGIDAYIASCPEEKQIQLKLMKEHRQSLRNCGISAWDYGRSIWLCRVGAMTSMFTEDEAWKHIGKVANAAQPQFNSWFHYELSYIVGRTYWRSDISKDSIENNLRPVKSYLADSANYWTTLDWNLPLSFSSN